MTVSVVIPHVPTPERSITLQRAIASVLSQTVYPDEIHIAVDTFHEGPAATRNRGLFASKSDWVLYLDDDDYLDANCIERLLVAAKEQNADVVYPWFRVANGTDPFPEFHGKQWDDDEPHIFPVTYLVRTGLAQSTGGFPTREELGNRWAPMWNGKDGGEDWFAMLALIELGAYIYHLPEVLWTWEHGGSHYSGSTW